MTTDEKLKRFLKYCVEDATSRSEKIIQDYTSALEQTFEEHKEDFIRQADLQIKLETERMERNCNKELSKEQIVIKRELGKKMEEIKDKIFIEVKDLLENYFSTPNYDQLLKKQIIKAKEISQGQEVTIYIDPVDSIKRHDLELATKTKLTVSSYSFMGGIRAVIPLKSILIDYSFASKLDEAKQNFKLVGGNING